MILTQQQAEESVYDEVVPVGKAFLEAAKPNAEGGKDRIVVSYITRSIDKRRCTGDFCTEYLPAHASFMPMSAVVNDARLRR